MIDLLAPKDSQERRKGFYVMLDQRVGGSPQPNGMGCHPIFLDGDRLAAQARIVGSVFDEEILERLTTAAGVQRLVHSIGVFVQAENRVMKVKFSLIFYGAGGSESGSRYAPNRDRVRYIKAGVGGTPSQLGIPGVDGNEGGYAAPKVW